MNPIAQKTLLTTEQQRDLAIRALEDIKAKDIVVMETAHLTSLFEYMIVASGDSNRQVKALANNVAVTLKEQGIAPISTEGETSGDWVLVDFGGLVVHVMQPPVRAYYNLEQLWGGARPASLPTL